MDMKLGMMGIAFTPLIFFFKLPPGNIDNNKLIINVLFMYLASLNEAENIIKEILQIILEMALVLFIKK